MASKVNLDVSEVLDITCRQGDTFELTLTLKDSSGSGLNLSTDNYSFVMQVWPSNRRGSNPLIATTEKGLKGRNLNTQELPGAAYFEPFVVDDNGNVTIKATAATMRNVPAGRHIYDLQFILPTASGVDTHTTVLRGSFTINEDVTKAARR
tara:strand:+ start:1917 stop:2369 length:453 start_codon:yes stop_codon:yes gene_type:complete